MLGLQKHIFIGFSKVLWLSWFFILHFYYTTTAINLLLAKWLLWFVSNAVTVPIHHPLLPCTRIIGNHQRNSIFCDAWNIFIVQLFASETIQKVNVRNSFITSSRSQSAHCNINSNEFFFFELWSSLLASWMEWHTCGMRWWRPACVWSCTCDNWKYVGK